jgi:hypothetical protein
VRSGGEKLIVIKKVFLTMLLGIFAVTAGCSSQNDNMQLSNQKNKTEAKAVQFQIIPAKSQKVDQIRGIGFPGNDKALYIATNNGLKFYLDSKWLETSTNKHNDMSLQAIEAGFLASGHPQKGLGLKDPLGLVESTDKGKSLKKLAFYGKSNFHFVAASFSGNGIYLINEQSNGKLDPGVYFSTNGGEDWSKSKLTNFSADSLGMIAVHSKSGNIMAMSTRTGLFYSEDYGNTMKAVTGPEMITALTFNGDEILYSSVEDQKILLKKINPKTGEQVNVVFPFLDYDNPVTYLAVNPKNENELAFATYKNDLYESTDGGKNWNNILAGGKFEQE